LKITGFRYKYEVVLIADRSTTPGAVVPGTLEAAIVSLECLTPDKPPAVLVRARHLRAVSGIFSYSFHIISSVLAKTFLLGTAEWRTCP